VPIRYVIHGSEWSLAVQVKFRLFRNDCRNQALSLTTWIVSVMAIYRQLTDGFRIADHPEVEIW